MRIVTTVQMSPAEQSFLRESASEDLAIVNASDPSSRQAILDAEILFGQCPADLVAASRKLRWIQLDSVGFDSLRKLDWRELGRRITCTNLRDFFSTPVAESALAGVLALYRGLDRLIPLKDQRRWEKSQVRPALKTVAGARVLVVGLGGIGKKLSALFGAMGAMITTFGRTPGSANLHTPDQLDTALADADIVCVTLPETDQTRRLFDAPRLARLKREAIFVNVGRGGVVDETSLVRALGSGALGGAVLDVTQIEPLPADHPLWRCPNTILTQHTGGGWQEENRSKIRFFLDNLARHRRGEPLMNVVAFEKGY